MSCKDNAPSRAKPADAFVHWFRSVAPYVHAFRGRTFVLAFGGKAASGDLMATLAYDVNLLASFGVRLVLVHGARPQIEEELALRQLKSRFHGGLRITDAETLTCVVNAVGELSLRIVARLSQGLPNTPMAGAGIRVVRGNFVTARPLGVIDGVDFHYTGAVRKVDAEGIRAQLDMGNLVLSACIGASPTGEIFNLAMEEVAETVAVALKADKLIFLTDSDGLPAADGGLWHELTTAEANGLQADREGDLSPDQCRYLPCATRAVEQGVGRAHLISYQQDGALLRELFTHDGVGSMVTREPLERIRQARVEDVGALLQFIAPLEADGTLVRRDREILETEVDRFSLVEYDGRLVGCAALYPFSEGKAGELACLAIDPVHRRGGLGERLMQRIEEQAKAAGIGKLYVLTTRAEHWFVERGYKEVGVEDLPRRKREIYNYHRRSVVLVKALHRSRKV